MVPMICALAERRRTVLACALFGGTLVFFLCAVHIGWQRSLLEDQSFRQTQTAITAYHMVGRPPRLAYETPVLGPPWSIPFEFPVYQWIVAGAVTLFQTPLEQTGRFVSVIFYLLTLIPVNSILKSLRFDRVQRCVALSFMLVSPYYVYWSRAFLIESTALFWCISYLALTIRFLDKPSVMLAVSVTVAGALASLVKVTTFIPFLLGAGIYWAYALRRHLPATMSQLTARIASPVFLAGVPICLTLWWTNFADAQKAMSRIGQMTTSATLTAWNFGTWEQRLTVEYWREVGTHYRMMIGQAAFLTFCIFALRSSSRRWPMVTALILAASGPLIFTNLYVYHAYYAYATGLLLVMAVAMGIVTLLEQGVLARRLAPVVIAAFVAVCVIQYFQHFYPKQSSRVNGRWLRLVTRAIQEETAPDDVILVLGYDWSSELPYYSQRRALMIPDWHINQFLLDPRPYFDDLRGYRLGAILVYVRPDLPLNPDDIRRLIEIAGMNSKPRWVHSYMYALYLPRIEEAPDAVPSDRSPESSAASLRW